MPQHEAGEKRQVDEAMRSAASGKEGARSLTDEQQALHRSSLVLQSAQAGVAMRRGALQWLLQREDESEAARQATERRRARSTTGSGRWGADSWQDDDDDDEEEHGDEDGEERTQQKGAGKELGQRAGTGSGSRGARSGSSLGPVSLDGSDDDDDVGTGGPSMSRRLTAAHSRIAERLVREGQVSTHHAAAAAGAAGARGGGNAPQLPALAQRLSAAATTTATSPHPTSHLHAPASSPSLPTRASIPARITPKDPTKSQLASALSSIDAATNDVTTGTRAFEAQLSPAASGGPPRRRPVARHASISSMLGMVSAAATPTPTVSSDVYRSPGSSIGSLLGLNGPAGSSQPPNSPGPGALVTRRSVLLSQALMSPPNSLSNAPVSQPESDLNLKRGTAADNDGSGDQGEEQQASPGLRRTLAAPLAIGASGARSRRNSAAGVAMLALPHLATSLGVSIPASPLSPRFNNNPNLGPVSASPQQSPSGGLSGSSANASTTSSLFHQLLQQEQQQQQLSRTKSRRGVSRTTSFLLPKDAPSDGPPASPRCHAAVAAFSGPLQHPKPAIMPSSAAAVSSPQPQQPTAAPWSSSQPPRHSISNPHALTAGGSDGIWAEADGVAAHVTLPSGRQANQLGAGSRPGTVGSGPLLLDGGGNGNGNGQASAGGGPAHGRRQWQSQAVYTDDACSRFLGGGGLAGGAGQSAQQHALGGGGAGAQYGMGGGSSPSPPQYALGGGPGAPPPALQRNKSLVHETARRRRNSMFEAAARLDAALFEAGSLMAPQQ